MLHSTCQSADTACWEGDWGNGESDGKLDKPGSQKAYRIGGWSALTIGVSYMIITGLYVLGGALPVGAEAWLKHLASHTSEWWVILGLSIITDLLYLPVAWALYVCLRKSGKNAAFTGAVLLALFVILDLAITWPDYASLIGLSGKYASAANDTQRMSIVASASHPYEVLSSPLFGVYTLLVPGLGILGLGIAMLHGPFSKATTYLGIVTGIGGIISVAGPIFLPSLGIAAVATSVLTLIWFLMAGQRLLGLGK